MSGFQSAYAFRENRGCVHREFSKHKYEFYIKVQFISHGKSFLQKKRFAKIRFERFREESFGESIFARRRRNCVFGWKFASKWVLLINLVSGFGRNNKKKKHPIYFSRFSHDGFSALHSFSFASRIDERHWKRYSISGSTNRHGLFPARGFRWGQTRARHRNNRYRKNSIQSELAKIY